MILNLQRNCEGGGGVKRNGRGGGRKRNVVDNELAKPGRGVSL